MRAACSAALLVAALAAAPASRAAADGPALYAQHCASCHQADGAGTVGLAPALKGQHWTRLGADRAYLLTVLVHGLSGAIQVGGQTFVGSMPAFGSQLDDAALAALATHVRGLQGAAGEPAYASEEARAVRQAAGSPPQSRQRRLKLLGN
ncbi:cytochrome c [Ramlibacter sp. 2FC]|uniref:c-type cytochrome n=1 Tax=Ramlibacter sp. 2FC TaxID=2502188 RepID=UPI0010F72A8B|nr:cytochrome c [Ramlibacter sp. 2FC]